MEGPGEFLSISRLKGQEMETKFKVEYVTVDTLRRVIKQPSGTVTSTEEHLEA